VVTTDARPTAEAADFIAPEVREAEAALAAAEAALAEARRAQKERELAARRAAEEREKVREKLARAAKKRVEKLESQLATTRQETAQQPGIGPLPLRRVARDYLHGDLKTDGAGVSREDVVAKHDGAARLWLELAADAATVLARLTDSTVNACLDEAQGLIQRADAVEIAAWRGFVLRVSQMAGE